MNRLLCAALLVVVNMANAQDHVGSGRALKLDGVDDYVDLGNIYDDAVLPITVSAWLYFEPDADPAAIFVSQDRVETLVSRGFDLNVSRQSVGIQYGDGTGGGTPAFRRGKAAFFPDTGGKWVHITGVLDSYSIMTIYVNGVDVSGEYVGSAAEPMASNFPNDVAKIGYRAANDIVYHFKGMIDELRIWNRALSQTEIRDKMCVRLTGNEPGLIGYWNFDETSGNTVFDSSPKGFNGTLINGTKRVFSGAPVGDSEGYLYPNVWENTQDAMTVEVGDHSLSVREVQGDPPGIYVYNVNMLPSQLGGLDLSKIAPPYLGVFVARTNYAIDGTFSLHYEISNLPVCEFDTRKDNSVASWTDRQELSDIKERIEVMAYRSPDELNPDLGADRTICDNTSTILISGFPGPGTSFFWSTGETTSEITVDAPGIYVLQVKQGCVVGYDTIEVVRFPGESAIIKPNNIITPDNGDMLNQYFELEPALEGSPLVIYNRWGKEVFATSSYQNDWCAPNLASGIYFYRIDHECAEYKGSITVMK